MGALDKVLALSRGEAEMDDSIVELTWSPAARAAALKARQEHKHTRMGADNLKDRDITDADGHYSMEKKPMAVHSVGDRDYSAHYSADKNMFREGGTTDSSMIHVKEAKTGAHVAYINAPGHGPDRPSDPDGSATKARTTYQVEHRTHPFASAQRYSEHKTLQGALAEAAKRHVKHGGKK